MRRILFPIAASLSLLLLGGCRNPFEPSSDVELADLTAVGWGAGQNNSNGGGSTILVHANDAAALPLNLDAWRVQARIIVKNKVDVYINSIAITYTDLDGNEVTSYRSIGGRNLKLTVFCRGVLDDSGFDGTEGRYTTFMIYIVDSTVIRELRSPSYPDTNVMFANLVLRGEDANGYDVRLEGQIAIQYIE